MLHTRIRRWKLGRNHKFPEMRTAALLLAAHQEEQRQRNEDRTSFLSSPTSTGNTRSRNMRRPTPPSFIIRGEIVRYAEFMRYFKRKKINDPLSWAKEEQQKQEDNEFVMSEDVEILTSTDTGTPESDSGENDESRDTLDGGREAEGLIQVEQPIPQAQDLDIDHNHSVTQVDLSQVPLTAETQDLHQPESYSTSNQDCWSSSFILPASEQYQDTVRQRTAHQMSMPAFFRPQTYRALEHLTHSMTVYITSYMTSERARTQCEPAVHALTVHAIFASRMQDGVALLANVSTRPKAIPHPRRHEQGKSPVPKPDPNAKKAFDSFRNGFELIRSILENDHPMSLALILSIACELAGHASKQSSYVVSQNQDREHEQGQGQGIYTAVLVQLLQYIRDMASLLTVLGPSHALTSIFTVLAQVCQKQMIIEDPGTFQLANLIHTILYIAIARLSAGPEGFFDWKLLYLRERLCDSLYHSGAAFIHERMAQRASLLRDQEHKYGLTARNVLWTLTNVADDALGAGDVDVAVHRFHITLQRAERLSDYGRAKTRFAALEGLGRCFLLKAEQQMQIEAEVEAESEENTRLRALGDASAEENTLSEKLHDVSSRVVNPSSSSAFASRGACCLCSCHHSSTSTTTPQTHHLSARNNIDTGTGSETNSTSDTGTSTPSTSTSSSRPQSHNPNQQQRQSEYYLREALRYFSAAEHEARVWFDSTSRRIARVRRHIAEVREMLGYVDQDREDDDEAGKGDDIVAAETAVTETGAGTGEYLGPDLSFHPLGQISTTMTIRTGL
ncbi:uncharacterized protein Z518_06204 [Rhinocladiella mackenziei CBS 650.93]|uniref:Clr5 domain-containing protein n=1 Tax=Rhinocladiella mackenziei CBS 650.93 TaxID=1442369 RepID=A0A0D2FTA3_9EURO|nr:uncharacterized protein Z518_06204 [Rhinocladiella mackenziei CBS 650.93]KIX05332.1 hypothetical protein Z518_06204 [Rhinocladiella mackenziei CBS 650.93]